jgi:hypothetical protein
MRKFWLLMFLLAVRLGSAQEVDPLRSLAGCYELRVLRPSPLDFVNADVRLPRKFSLTTQANSPFGFVAKNLDPRVEGDSFISFWTAKDKDTLVITWSTLFSGYKVHLKRSGEEFRGTAEYSSDDTGGSESHDVVANTAQCEQKKN